MAKLSILAGTTSKLFRIFVPNSSVTTGAGLTGLAFNTSGLTGYYIREGAGSTTQITLATQTLGTWATGGFIVVDGTNMPGMYEISIPNAAIASGAASVIIYFNGATNMSPVVLEIELTAVNNQSTAFGLSLAKTTNITGFNDIAATAIVSSGAINTSSGAVSTVTTVTNQLTSAQIATGVWQDATSGDFTASASIGKALYINAVPGATGGHFIAGTNAATTITTSLTTTFTGSLTGSVASVSGAVGSVTGAVGSVTGNVGGSVASVSGAVGSVTGAVASVTGNVGGNVVGSVASVTNAVTVSGTSTLTESYAAQGSGVTLAQALYMILQFLGQHSLASTIWTVKKRDGATTAKTYTLDSATAPTTISETT